MVIFTLMLIDVELKVKIRFPYVGKMQSLINPRRACAVRVTVVGSVCVCVCLSVKSHLTYGASVRPENAVTYSAGNEGQNFCGVFSETAPLQRSSTPSVVWPCVQSAIFQYVFLVYAHAYSRVYTRMIHRGGFSTLVLFILYIVLQYSMV